MKGLSENVAQIVFSVFSGRPDGFRLLYIKP